MFEGIQKCEILNCSLETVQCSRWNYLCAIENLK